MHYVDRLDLFKVLSEDGKNLLEFEEETGELCSACKANSFYIVYSDFWVVCFYFSFYKNSVYLMIEICCFVKLLVVLGM